MARYILFNFSLMFLIKKKQKLKNFSLMWLNLLNKMIVCIIEIVFWKSQDSLYLFDLFLPN